MSVDTLSAVLQGLNNGARTGLDIYKTVQDEERAKRAESLKLQRFAIEDTRYENEQSYQQQQDTLAQANNERDFKEKTRQFDSEQKRLAAEAQARNALDSRRIAISENTYRDQKTAAEMERLRSTIAAEMVNPQTGQLESDPAVINARLRAKGLDDGLGKLLAYMAPERYGRGNYTGVKAVATPTGFAAAVSGTDMEGKPIKGWAPATANGSANDKDVPTMGYDQAAFMLVNPNLITEIQANNLQRMEAERATADEKLRTESRIRSGGGDEAGLAAGEQTLANAQRDLQTAEETPAPEQPGFAKLATSLASQWGITPPKGEREVALEQAQGEVQGAQQELERRRSLRAYHEGMSEQNLARGQESRDMQRATLGAAGYLTQRQTASTQGPAQFQKQWGETQKSLLDGINYPSKKVKNDDGLSETVQPVTKAHMQSQLDSLDPEMQTVIAQNPKARAAVRSYMQTMADLGQSTGLERFVDAASRGADLEKYTQFVRDGAMHKGNGWSDEQVHTYALSKAMGYSEKDSLANATR